jgi:hypothetical protein
MLNAINSANLQNHPVLPTQPLLSARWKPDFHASTKIKAGCEGKLPRAVRARQE